MRAPSSPQSASPFCQRLSLLGGKRVGDHPGAPGLIVVDPGPEVRRRERRERQQQIAEVPLGIDGNHRHTVDRGFFDERQAQAGLAAACHSDANGMRDEIARVVENEVVETLPRSNVVFSSQIKKAELLEILHPLIVIGIRGPRSGIRSKARIGSEGRRGQGSDWELPGRIPDHASRLDPITHSSVGIERSQYRRRNATTSPA